MLQQCAQLHAVPVRSWAAALSRCVCVTLQLLAEKVQQGRALEYADGVALAQKLMAEALAAYEEEGREPHVFVDIQSALMFSMHYGYFPPQRVSWIISLQHPWYKGACQHPDCIQPLQCTGNR